MFGKLLRNAAAGRQLLDGSEEVTAQDLPRHCSTNGECAAPGQATQKQRNNIKQFAAALGRSLPHGMESFSYHEAAEWLHRAFPEVAAAGGEQ